MKFTITRGKGFYLGFKNGWGVSVQFGPANYADNYDMPIGTGDIEAGKAGSDTAECAIITPKGDLFAHPDFGGDTVKGYCSPEEVLVLLKFAEEQDPNA